MIPERRSEPAGNNEKTEGLRIGVGSFRRSSPPEEPEVVRLEPSEATIARVEQKVSYADLVHDPNRRVRSREGFGEWGAEGQSLSWKWIVLSVIFVFGTIVCGIYFANDLVDSEEKFSDIGLLHLEIESRDLNSREDRIAELLDRQDEAQALYGRFVHAGSLKELLEMSRIETTVHYLVNRYERSPALPDDWEVPADCQWHVHSDATPIFGTLSGYFPDESTFKAFMKVEHGKLYVDWKASVRYSTASMEQLNAGNGDGSEIRVWVKPAVYYSPDFPESGYQSYFLYSEWEDPPVWGYAARGSELGRKIGSFFKESRITDEPLKPKMLLLSLAKEDKGLKNQWTITNLLHSEWISP